MALVAMWDILSRGNCKALDIGSGSGMLAAWMSLANKNGRTIGIDHIPELVAASVQNVARAGHKHDLLDSGRLAFVVADGREGYAPEAPYDVIHIGAGVSDISKFIRQLKPNGGTLVAPIGPDHHQLFQVITRSPDGTTTTKTITSCRYVPLTSAQRQVGT